MDNAKLKGFLNAFINIGANAFILGIVPPEYKGWALVIFNLAQVVYAFMDPSYTLMQIGKKMGQRITVEDLK